MSGTFPCLVLVRKRGRRWVPWTPDGQAVSFEEMQALRSLEVLAWRRTYNYGAGKVRRSPDANT